MSDVSISEMSNSTVTTLSPICHHPPAAKAAGSSFYWALRLLPSDQREAMFRIYAFCREVDDIADEPGDAQVKMDRLEAWRGAVESLFGEDEPVQSIACLKPVVEDYGLNKADLIAVIDGMETDAHDAVRMPDEAAFDLYLDRVASAVGRLSDKVFGLDDKAAEQLAHHLGRALQITNILRDLQEDAERNRLYLPQDLLRAEGIETDTPHAVLRHAGLVRVLDILARRAQDHFSLAQTILATQDKSKTRPARVMMAVYRRVLEKLELRGLSRIDKPVHVSKAEKLWLAVRHGIL